MGWFAKLAIGKRYEFTSRKYTIPYTWCRLFDGFDSRGIGRTTVKNARDKLHSSGLTLDLLENQISEYSGYDLKQWQQGRKFILEEIPHDLRRNLEGVNKKEYEDEEWDISEYLDFLQDDQGLFELVALYKLFLSIEAANPSEIVTLDLHEFALEDEKLEEVIGDTRKEFIDTTNVYRFLDRYVIDKSDKTSLVKTILSSLNEDELINEVLLPLLPKMGFHNVNRLHHHGPYELGLDIRPFYEIDKFGHRIYYGAQVKAVDINANSSKKEGGNVEAISYQLQLALDSKFLDEEDNEEKEIDRVLLITSKNINELARKVLHKKFPNRQLSIMDGKLLAQYLVINELTDMILHLGFQPKRLKRRSRNE